MTHRANSGKGIFRRWQRRVVEAQKDDGGINEDATHCGDVAQLRAGKFNCSVEKKRSGRDRQKGKKTAE